MCESMSITKSDSKLSYWWCILLKRYLQSSQQLFNFFYFVILCAWPSIQRHSCNPIFWLQYRGRMGFWCLRWIFDRGWSCIGSSYLGNRLLLLFTMSDRLHIVHITLHNWSYFNWIGGFDNNGRFKQCWLHP